MLVHPVGLTVPATVHDVLTRALAKHRVRLETGRKLSPARRARLVLVHQPRQPHVRRVGGRVRRRHGAQVRPGACQVLAGMAPTLDDALEQARSKAYLVLDGTVIETDRVRTRPKGADHARYSGKIGRHGMNERWSSPQDQVMGLDPGWWTRCVITRRVPA